MATITRKGHRGKRDIVLNARPSGESTVNDASNDGKRQGSEPEAGIQEIPSAKGQGCSFGKLVDAVKNESRMVATCWHPKPTENVVSRNDCDVRVLTGEAAYQLSSGAIIRL
jgi:hypothetical protein